MTPQSLKSAILQLAIQGKLVEQRPEEGSATPRLRPPKSSPPRTPKSSLSRSLTSFVPSSPFPPGTEPPFDIPETWRWVRLGDCTTYDSRKDKISPSAIPPDTWSLDLEDIEKDTGKIIKYCSASDRRITGDKVLFRKGQILYSKLRPYLKKILVAPRDGICSPELVPFSVFDGIEANYLVAVLRSPHVDFAINSVTYGVKMPRVGTETMVNLPIPLPPLPEQHRIVAKIEELLPLIDRYEQAWTKLEDFNRRFPADMQKSLLQLAIQGKLVPQLPEEGAGEDLYRKILDAKKSLHSRPSSRSKSVVRSPSSHPKLLPPITEDEIPFEIPDSWKWARLGDVADVQLGKMLDKGKNKGTPHPYLANLSVRWRSFDLSSLRTMPFTDHECEKFALLPGDVLMCEGGVPGRCAVWRQEHSRIKYQKAVHRIRSAVLFPDFIQLYFEAIVDNTWFAEQFTGTTIKHLPRERLIQTPVPLPPLAEQKRIVAKLEEFMPLCEKVK